MKKTFCTVLMLLCAQVSFAQTLEECSKLGDSQRYQYVNDDFTYVPANTLPAGEYPNSYLGVVISENPKVRLGTDVQYVSKVKFSNGSLSLKSLHKTKFSGQNDTYKGDNNWDMSWINLEINNEKFKFTFHKPNDFMIYKHVSHIVNDKTQAPFWIKLEVELSIRLIKAQYGDAAWGTYPSVPEDYDCDEYAGFCKSKITRFLKKLDSLKTTGENEAVIQCTKTFIENAYRGSY